MERAGFRVTEGRKHVKAVKAEPGNRTVKRVTVCRKGDKQFAKGYHACLLKQAGLTQEEFIDYLNK